MNNNKDKKVEVKKVCCPKCKNSSIKKMEKEKLKIEANFKDINAKNVLIDL